MNSNPSWYFIYNPLACPCRDCQDRSVDCHSKCDKYKKWLENKPKKTNSYSERNYGGKK